MLRVGVGVKLEVSGEICGVRAECDTGILACCVGLVLALMEQTEMSVSLPDTTKHRQDACVTWRVEAESLEKLCVELGSQVSRARVE